MIAKKRLEDYITSEMLIKYLRKIEDNSRVGQRFVYRVHGESILLSGIRREEMKQTVPAQLESLSQRSHVINIGAHASGNVVVIGEHNNVK